MAAIVPGVEKDAFFWSNERNRLTAGIPQNNSLQQKSRRNRTPAVFHCVGLLINGSPGHRPDYPLLSHPRTAVSAGSQFIPELHDTYIVRLPADEVNGLPNIRHTLCPVQPVRQNRKGHLGARELGAGVDGSRLQGFDSSAEGVGIARRRVLESAPALRGGRTPTITNNPWCCLSETTTLSGPHGLVRSTQTPARTSHPAWPAQRLGPF